jgi:hypothetical protein
MKPEKIEELERLCEAVKTCEAWNRADIESCMGEAVPELIREVRRLREEAIRQKKRADDAIRGIDELQERYDSLTGERFSDRCHLALRQRAEQAESEAKRLSVALANVSGALVDAGTVDVPGDVTEYGKAVRGVVRERDRALGVEDAARAACDCDGTPDKSICSMCSLRLRRVLGLGE